MRQVLTIFFLCLAFMANAQKVALKVGTNPTTLNASAVLEAASTTKGFLPPRMTTAQRNAIATPAAGLQIYNTTLACLQVNVGIPSAPDWQCLNSTSGSSGGTAIVSAYSCSTASTGTMSSGNAVSGVTQTITATVATAGTYNISAFANGVLYSGIGIFYSTGAKDIVLTATGTPTSQGTFNYALNTTPGCDFNITVTDGTSGGTAIVTAYDCGTAQAGNLITGQNVTGVTQTLTATVATAGTYSISAVANGVTFTASGTFAGTGAQAVILTAFGIPTADGSYNYNLNTAPNCSFSRISSSTPVVSTLNCAGATLTGTLTSGTAATGVFVTLPYTGGNGLAYNTQLLSSTGITGLVASLTPGTLSNSVGGNLIFTISGTPTTSGVATFAINFGLQTCSFSVNVNTAPAVASLSNCATATAGTLTAGTLASGVTQTISYTGGNGAGYSTISWPSAGVSGLTATATAAALATGNGNIVLTITGTPAVAGTATFNITFCGATCSFTRTVNAPAGTITGLTCGSVAFSPAGIKQNSAYSGTMTVPYTGGNAGVYSAGAGIASTGVTGLTASLQGGTLATGAGTLTYTVSGTASNSGTATFALSFGGQSCSVTTTVAAGAPVNPTGSGSLSGKSCFDIALSNDNANGCGTLVSRTAQKADFTQPATNTQTYTFTPSGTVSNVRFMYVNTNGAPITAITGGNAGNNITTAQNATVNYSTSLNTTALGLTTTTALTGDIYVVYNNGATNNGTDVQLKLTASIKDCACCGAYVAAGVYKVFMCHNLGADTSLNPNIPVDGINGNMYQWGRAAVVATASTTASSIAGWNTTSAPNGAWLDATKTANDPCPAGYRVPTNAQWAGVLANNVVSRTGSWANTSLILPYNSSNVGSAIHWGPNASTKTLTLPAAGCRSNTAGTLTNRGYVGYYWSSTETGPNADYLNFISGSVNAGSNYTRPSGLSVRCVSE